MTTHTCHAFGCLVVTEPKMFLCFRHWRILPERLRSLVVRHYRSGQEHDKRPSQAYLDVAHAARHWLHVHDGLPGRLCVVCIEGDDTK